MSAQHTPGRYDFIEAVMKVVPLCLLPFVLAACGGGGSASPSSEPISPVASDPVAAVTPVYGASAKVNPNCVYLGDHTSCELFPGDLEIGTPAHSFVLFTNNTGTALRLDDLQAITNEQAYWSEWCVYIANDPSQAITGQLSPGLGEVVCTSKKPGENYPLIAGALRVEPGQGVYFNSHTEPAAINHTYQLRVNYADASAAYAWRQPQLDEVIPCNGAQQATKWSAFTNHTGRALTVTGMSIYSESGNPAAPNTVANACLYVMDGNGNVGYANCASEFRTKGEVTITPFVLQPGEMIAAQAINTCQAPALWDWAAFIKVH